MLSSLSGEVDTHWLFYAYRFLRRRWPLGPDKDYILTLLSATLKYFPSFVRPHFQLASSNGVAGWCRFVVSLLFCWDNSRQGEYQQFAGIMCSPFYYGPVVFLC